MPDSERAAALAREAGVEHFVYTSVGSAHKRTDIPHFDNKWRIEETVLGLRFPSHVILRRCSSWRPARALRSPRLDAGLGARAPSRIDPELSTTRRLSAPCRKGNGIVSERSRLHAVPKHMFWFTPGKQRLK